MILKMVTIKFLLLVNEQNTAKNVELRFVLQYAEGLSIRKLINARNVYS